MPFLQWSAWLQYTHFGFLSLRVRVKLVRAATSADCVGTKPEKKPESFRGWHGSPKLDCATEWFCKSVSSILASNMGFRVYLGVKEILYCVANLGVDDLGVKLELAPFSDGHLIVGCVDRRRQKQGR
jgi:hypothetical protein